MGKMGVGGCPYLTLFPAPDGPRMANDSPGDTCPDTSFRICKGGLAFLIMFSLFSDGLYERLLKVTEKGLRESGFWFWQSISDNGGVATA